MESLNELSIQPQDGFGDKIESGVLTKNKSRSHVKLAEFEQQLHATEKKCKLVKKRLEYMRMVYQSVGPTGLETTVFDVPTIDSSKSIMINSREIYHEDFPKNIRQADEDGIPVVTSAKRPTHFTGKNRNKSSNDPEVKKRETKPKPLRNRQKHTEKIAREGACAIPFAPEEVSSGNNDINRYNNVSEPREIPLVSPPIVNSSRKSELILKKTGGCGPISYENNMQRANKSAEVLTCMNNVKLERNKLDNIGTGYTKKLRKRKIRMRATNSKSIAARKPAIIMQDSNFAKTNKCQVNIIPEKSQLESDTHVIVNISDEENTTDHPCKEVVEIYHNTAAKNTSVSVVSSKHQFKLDELKNPGTAGAVAKISMVDDDDRNNVHPQNDNGVRDEVYLCEGADRWIREPSDDDDTSRKHEKGMNEFGIKHQHGDCQQPTTLRSWCCESFAMRNYQQPTISSKLKQVKRCYFARRINLQNIPFVVGTSVTRSHNLGLNIQQVYSLMKHQQLSMPSDIRPVLIHKISGDINPMLSLDEQFVGDDHCMEQRAVMSSRLMSQPDTHRVGHIGQSSPLHNHGDTADMPAHTTQSSMLRQREEELNIEDDFKKYQSVTNNSGRIRNVLHRLHDQFEAMNDKHDKLSAEVEKTDDPNKRKELAELDRELTVKEEEISALMDIYKEILALKQQMKMYRGKSSVLCITTHSKRKNQTKVGSSLYAQRSRTAHNHLHSIDLPTLRNTNSTRRSVTATRLVGLLRQIQSFQQQFTTP